MYVGPFACGPGLLCLGLETIDGDATHFLAKECCSSFAPNRWQKAGRAVVRSFPNFVLSRPIFFHRAFPLGCGFHRRGFARPSIVLSKRCPHQQFPIAQKTGEGFDPM